MFPVPYVSLSYVSLMFPIFNELDIERGGVSTRDLDPN